MTTTNETVLAVDDDPRNIRILSRIFRNKVVMQTAADGQEALRKIADAAPALVLLDIMLPGTDGYEVCRQIRKIRHCRLTKVILVSGKALVEERLKGYDAGADDYVTKPFVHEEIEAKVEVFLRLFRAEKRLAELNASLEQEVKIRTEQSMRSERAAFIGMHSAEIVHNLSNPLTVIYAYAQRLEEKNPDDPDLREIKTASRKLSVIIESILTAVRGSGDEKKREIDLNEIIRSELRLAEIDEFAKYTVEIRTELSDIPTISGVPAHFQQVFGNIIRNAVDALRGSPRRILTVASTSADEKVTVNISDTGCGVPPQHMDRVFEPLFTTKTTNGSGDKPVGTGLGLASCKRMIEAYGGVITLESVVGQGTTVQLEVPLADPGRS